MIRIQDGLVPNRPVRIFVSIVTVLTVLGLARADVAATVAPALIAVALIAAVAVLYRQPAPVARAA